MRVGDYGTVFVLELVDQRGKPEPVADATDRKVLLTKPGGAVIERNAIAGAATHEVQFTLPQADAFDADGLWKIEAKVTTPAGLFHSGPLTWRVRPAKVAT